MFKLLISCLLFLLSPVLSAEVMHSAPDGFELKVEAEVDGSKQEVYEQFLRVYEWWDGDHSWFGKASGFSLDARAGGCFCEVDGDKSVMHMQVSFVDPGNRVAMIGGLGPLQDLGLYGAMSWNFEVLSDTRTKVVHTYRVMGYYPDGLEELAVAVDRVQTLQVSRLEAKLAGEL